MITNKALNARVKALYNLPATLTGAQIVALSLGAFANHSFTLPSGEHITAISESMIQVRKGDAVRTFTLTGNPHSYRAMLAASFAVIAEFDPTYGI